MPPSRIRMYPYACIRLLYAYECQKSTHNCAEQKNIKTYRIPNNINCVLHRESAPNPNRYRKSARNVNNNRSAGGGRSFIFTICFGIFATCSCRRWGLRGWRWRGGDLRHSQWRGAATGSTAGEHRPISIEFQKSAANLYSKTLVSSKIEASVFTSV